MSDLLSEDGRSQLLATYRDGLLNDTIPFWIACCADQQNGGFMFARDRDGTLVDTDKGVWQQARFTWMLGELYNRVEPKSEWLELAKHGMDFIEKRCFDSSDGRMWFHLTREGQPIRKRRYAFSEGFASIAYGELAQATGNQHYVNRAKETFQRFIDHNMKPTGEPKFTDTRPTRGIGFPMIGIVAAQQLRDSIQLETANDLIDHWIGVIRDYHVKPELQCVMETVGPQGQVIDHFDQRTLNPGHAIECAWFVMSEGKYRQDDDLVQLGCQMLDWMWNRGWDSQHGGLLYFVDLHGGPVQEYWHDMKFWWPHNEAIIATLLAHELTGDNKYATMHALVHDWAHKHFADPDHGEWFGYLHRDGSVSSTLKGNLWKGPFHLPRMQLECWQLLSHAR